MPKQQKSRFVASGPMPGKRIAECLEILGWSRRQFGDMLGKDEKAIRNAIAEEGKPLPEDVTEVLEARARHAKLNPFPVVDGMRAEKARVRRENDRRLRGAASNSAA